MPAEVTVAHRYPAAHDFLRREGADAVAVLHELLTRAERIDGELVAQASVRDIARSLEYLSKDSVNRRLRQLVRAGTLTVVPNPQLTFAPTRYVLHLDDTGIAVIAAPTA